MFKTVESRFILRASVATVLALLGAVQVAVFDGSISGIEMVGIGTATLTALGGYLGIGAAVAPVEPSIGNKLPDAP